MKNVLIPEVLIVAYIVISIIAFVYHVIKDKKTKAKDDLERIALSVFLIVMYSLGYISIFKACTVIWMVIMFLTAAGMLLFKVMPFVFNFVKINDVDTHSDIYNKDVIEFAIRLLYYGILTFLS